MARVQMLCLILALCASAAKLDPDKDLDAAASTSISVSCDSDVCSEPCSSMLLLQIGHHWQHPWQVDPNAYNRSMATVTNSTRSLGTAGDPRMVTLGQRSMGVSKTSMFDVERGGVRSAALKASGSLLVLALMVLLIEKLKELWPERFSKRPVTEQQKNGLEAPSEAAAGAITKADNRAHQAVTSQLGWYVLLAAFGHMASSSIAVVVTKIALLQFHRPDQGDSGGGYMWTLFFIQNAFHGIVSKMVILSGHTKNNAGIEMSTAIGFIPVAGMSLATIVAGNAITNYADVNTYLVTRALLPLPTSLLEMWAYREKHPPFLAWVALVITSIAAIGFVGGASSAGADIHRAIPWLLLFFTLMPLDGLVLKHGVTKTNLPAWNLVYVKSVLMFIPLAVYVGIFELYSWESAGEMLKAVMQTSAVVPLIGTCLSTLGVLYFQMLLAYYISFTAFAVLSVASKILSLALNVIFVEYQGLEVVGCVLLCILGAVLWQHVMQGSVVKVRDETFASDQYPAVQAFLVLALLTSLAVIEHLNK